MSYASINMVVNGCYTLLPPVKIRSKMKSEKEIKEKIEVLLKVRKKIAEIILKEQYIENNIQPFEKLVSDINRCDNEISILTWILS